MNIITWWLLTLVVSIDGNPLSLVVVVAANRAP